MSTRWINIVYILASAKSKNCFAQVRILAERFFIGRNFLLKKLLSDRHFHRPAALSAFISKFLIIYALSVHFSAQISYLTGSSAPMLRFKIPFI